MEVVTREYKVYNFSELSEDAKEKAKQWYLDDDFRPLEFRETMLLKDTPEIQVILNKGILEKRFSITVINKKTRKQRTYIKIRN